VRGVGGVGKDAVGAPSVATALEEGLDADELARKELERLTVGDLEADPQGAGGRQRFHGGHPGPPLEPAGPEPVVVHTVDDRLLGVVRAAARRPALEVARPEPRPGLLPALPRNQSPR